MNIPERTDEDINVLHMSENFLVVNKQWDIAINSDTPNVHPVTIATQLKYKFPNLYDPSVKFGFRFCHRLDYSTSGVLCLALNKNAAKESYKTLYSKKADKYYLALVHGHICDNHLVINKPIGIDSRPDYTHCMCTSDKVYCTSAKYATTKLLILQRGYYNGRPATKILLKLITGRRHQIRVHCHELGHTIIGDFTYSDRKDLAPYRMFLHAFKLHLPTEIENIDVTTDDPFTERDPRNKWLPNETVNELDEKVFSKL